MKAAGVATLILTNAAGGIDLDHEAGDLMLITDHINMMGFNPLTGPNEEDFGQRFPDMTWTYTPELINLAKACARDLGIAIREGIYVGGSGPSYETPAEIRMLRKLGANATGMSTVPEAIVASHCRMKILGISCITNLASGILDAPLTEEEVIEVARMSGDKFTRLLTEIIGRM
jgi:purine-nucleoside phosphorylase